MELQFRGEKTAKVVGRLAIEEPRDAQILSGVLVRRNFNFHLMHPADLSGTLPLPHPTLPPVRLTFCSSVCISNVLPSWQTKLPAGRFVCQHSICTWANRVDSPGLGVVKLL